MPIIQRVSQTEATDYVDESVFEEESETEVAEQSQSLRKGIGWDASEDYLKTSSSVYFKATDEPALVSFAAETPVHAYKQHWVGKTSLQCLEKDCPLCEVGETPRARVVFAVVVFEFKGAEINTVSSLWDTPPTVAKSLRAIDEDARKGGPLFHNFFSVYATGTGKQTSTVVTPVKRRDLEDAPWGIPTSAAVEAVESAVIPSVFKPNVSELRQQLSDAASAIRKSA